MGLARQSKKRASLRAGYDAVVSRVFLRARGQCEVVLDGTRCARRAKDAHHVVKRSQGGPDTPENLLACCRACHDRTDAPYHRGRLCITPLGAGRFACEMVYAADKWDARAGA